MLDIGCGEGLFTSELVDALKDADVLPKSITGIDPDADNLKHYRRRLESFSKLPVVCRKGGVESLPKGKWFVVISSHSLYQLLETPQLDGGAKRAILKKLFQHAKTGGVVLISLASIKSPAYEYKRRVLKMAGQEDRSLFGEELAVQLKNLGIKAECNTHDSYMDVTKLLKPTNEMILDWTRYFCRLSVKQTKQIGLNNLRATMRNLSKTFFDLPKQLAASYSAAPAACGSPKANTKILPHKECFIVVRT